MFKQDENENAANRTSYVGHVYNIGEHDYKSQVLASLPTKWSQLHTEGYIHIHDLDAYGLTYNCLTFNMDNFPIANFSSYSETGKIVHVFGFLKIMLTEFGNEQSGGMSFANFDIDIAKILDQLPVSHNVTNSVLIKEEIADLILWCNENHTRMGEVSYYVTLCIGLARTDFAREIALDVIDDFEKAGDLVYKPNIVFKVSAGISRNPGDRNYDLLKRALLCTAKKMIPTYLLCDCEEDKDFDPKILSIMGCRTRVVDDLFKDKGAIGRSNIDNITINLPRLALEIDRDYPDSSIDEKLATYKKRWMDIASLTKDILIDRYQKTVAQTKEDFPTNLKLDLWCESFKKAKTLNDVFKHGTLSIGFIGLSEAFEVLTGKRYYTDPDTYMIALGFVKYMRDYCDFLRKQYQMNFSLLATSGELISGRFTAIDQKLFKPRANIFSKGFYTNSFHVNVDSNLPAYKKIQMEGLFHRYCNGGSITYVELKEAPLGNDEGLDELVEIAIKSGVHYLGFNFPKDICNTCGATGVFDCCPTCHSHDITRIRRVSGYLEILDGFTPGKKAEVKTRKAN